MKLKGYIFSRSFYGERAPQHIQNLVIRDYCKKNSYTFLLSGTEYSLKNSTYILNEILENLNQYDGIVFYSLLQLPYDIKFRNYLYSQILKKKKSLHFVVENLKIENLDDKNNIEKILKLKIANQNLNVNKFGNLKNFITPNHKKTKRKYLDRMINNKSYCMKISKKYGQKYWDGDRMFGYGGYKYIKGYHEQLAKNLIKNYNLNNKSKILDIGCGKGYLMYEIKKILNGAEVLGLDISRYAKKNSKKEISKFIKIHDLRNKLNYNEKYFDLVYSINTFHNLKLDNIFNRLKDMEFIGKNQFLCVESFRNEIEQFNLQCWALTAETLIDTDSWKWLLKISGYSGDYEFIYFE